MEENNLEIEANIKPSRKEKRKLKREKRFSKYLKYNLDNDIKYLGPISIRTLKMIAWILMACSTSLLGLMAYLNVSGKSSAANSRIVTSLLYYAGQLAIPCFILTKFSTIMRNKKGYVDMLIKYAAASIAILVLFNLLYFHYAVPLISAATGESFSEATKTLNGYFATVMGKKLAFNVFIDLLMWALYFFFVEYKNEKIKGKKLVLFRLGSLIPIIYVNVCFVFKILFALNKITIPSGFLPLLSTSSPLTFLAFVLISLFLKNHKKTYVNYGGSEEEYNEYLKTKANSFHFSKVTALCFVVVGIFDLILKAVLSGFVEADMMQRLDVIAGIGDSAAYLAFAPFILLFSYTRSNKDTKFDVLIPIIGVIIVVVFAFEGFFQSALVLIKYYLGEIFLLLM